MATIYVIQAGAPDISVSGGGNQGPKPTFKVATGPSKFAPKISKSLVNNPLGVNKPVAFGARKEPYKRAVIRALPSIRYNVAIEAVCCAPAVGQAESEEHPPARTLRGRRWLSWAILTSCPTPL